MTEKFFFQLAFGGRLGFMHVINTRVAQSCHFGKKAEFVLGPNYITKHQIKFIEKNISMLVY